MFTPQTDAGWLEQRLGDDWTVGPVGEASTLGYFITHIPSARSDVFDSDLMDVPDPVSVVKARFPARDVP